MIVGSFVLIGANGINGSIPSTISALTALKYLSLSSNQLSSSMPSIAISGLTWLDLSGNQLSGSIQPAGLSSLVALYLNNNLLTGSIPASFTVMNKLS